eukprot:a174349_697.p1 GENE.a174349_697~~a174349_697.p1  ORF type:complete len:645 (-),score=318.38 a174349_697:42-1946(-)
MSLLSARSAARRAVARVALGVEASKRGKSSGQVIKEKLGHHSELAAYVAEYAALLKPANVVVCDGSKAEFDGIMNSMVKNGAAIKLNEKLRPNSYLMRSDPSDVARSEDKTWVNTRTKEESGPTNNWRAPEEQKAMNHRLFNGAMEGRTMYVVPFSMGPLGGAISKLGVELTDSPLVAASMRIMTRMGKPALDVLGSNGAFVRAVHSVGAPLKAGQQDVTWPCNHNDKFITHFPEENLIESYGSGYGGNALLGKKSYALRIASFMGQKEGWFAEHMLILGLTSPQGVKKYFAAAFPSACGKTNLAMMLPSLPGWKLECVGDDIAWMRFDAEGRLRAVNPEFGYFGVAPGTGAKTNPNALASCSRDALFTNVALTREGDVWWEGLSKERPTGMINWLGKNDDGKSPAAHPNSRFTVPAINCPVLDPLYDSPDGVPIDGIIFGGRRPTTIPLVNQSLSWDHGVFMGSSIASQKTAAATGSDIGQVRRDPFAMLPFFGYNAGDYFAHWVKMGKTRGAKLPKIFTVNWFREDAQGKFIWPGFGDNARVLKWIFDRCDAKGLEKAVETPIGYMPRASDLDLSGLNMSSAVVNDLLAVNKAEWAAELESVDRYYDQFGSHCPAELHSVVANIKKRLAASK